MGIELPPELADVAAKAGVAWPEADEEAMARQAQAWRDTATSMSTLATDADTTARTALRSVKGETGSVASTEWKTFVEPDTGHLTSVVRDANAAANRLEHAANQVGAAKVEIVRNLVGLAQNTDAAHAAAQAGHPLALAGLDTAVRGTAANVAHIESQLVSAVQPTSGVDMAAVQNPVNANPGHHLLAGVTTTAAPLTATVTDTVTDTGQTAAALTSGTLNQGTHLPAAAGQGATDLVHHGTGLVGDTAGQVAPGADDLVHHGTGMVGDTAGQVVPGAGDLVQPGAGDHSLPGAGDLVQPGIGDHPLPGAGDLVQPGTGGHSLPGAGDHSLPAAGDLVQPGTGDHSLPGVGHPGDVLPGQPGSGPDTPGHALPDLLPGDPEITGPVPATHFPGDVPTPPTGQTAQAGFVGGMEPSAAAPANLPPAAAIPQPANPAAPAPAFGGAPGFAGTPFAAPAPPIVGGAPAVGAPAGGGIPAPAQPAPARPAAFAPAASIPADRPQDPLPRKQMAGPPGAPPAKGESNEVLAAFWIHMFPIGHLPVASYRPARQLPPPAPELDYAAGLRFEPADHPQFDLIDTAPRLAELKATIAEQKPSHEDYAPPPSPGYPPAPPAHPAEAVAAGYPPPGQPGKAPPAYPQAATPSRAYPPATPSGAYPPATPSRPAVAAGYPQAAPAGIANVATYSPAVPGQAVAPGAPASAVAAQPGPAHQPAPSPPSPAEAPPAPRRLTPSAGLTADHPTVHTLLENHDPLGGGHERDWDRRYLVRLGSVTAHGISPEGLEYNWPTSEQYPEGGSATGEAETLPANTVIDRFGTPHGRVFAENSTPFAQRSLPPAHKDAGYRRYRVTKPIPVWRAVSAAWFGQPGGGVRYRTTHSAVELVALGYLEEIA
jgi:hypothetical protein